MSGFTYVTFLAVMAGLVTHALKHYVAARRMQTTITLRAYYVDRWPESAISIVCAFVLWGGLPELAEIFPELAAQIGLTADPGIISSFVCGFVGNSLADFVGGRAKLISGGE